MPFTILYVEDDEITREYMSQLLKEVCTHLIVAIDGEDGLLSFNEQHVDLIITDYKMPKINGLEFIEKIRSNNHVNSNVDIIILSAYEDPKVIRNCISHNIQEYLLKPIVFSELILIIDKFKTNKLNYGEHQLIDYLNSINSSLVIYIKVNEFKYLNLSLKSKISKKLQITVANKLFSNIPKTYAFTSIYILENGGFAFAVPFNQSEWENDFPKKIQDFQHYINSEKTKINDIDYLLSIKISLAYGKNAYENAKIGMLKLVETQEEFILATDLFDKEKKIAVKKLKQLCMLKKALKDYNIISHFQPIINNQTKEIEKYESLVRLIDSEKNIVSPYFFLNTAKEGKYYQEITSIVLKNSFRALLYTNKSISINLSALDIEKDETRKIFMSLLERYKTDTHRLVLELLEDEHVKNEVTVKLFLKKIKEYGVKIAIDDFGVGLSNFSRILDYEPDYIKIDGSIIKNIYANDISKNIVRAIVTFSKIQNIKTIAEYVENEEIYDTLCELGVDYSQGYYFGKPASLYSYRFIEKKK